MPVRVAIVDDDAPYRGAIADLLALESSFEVVASFGDARQLLAAAAKTPAPQWDMVLMDIEMPGLDGISATTELKTRLPDPLVVMLTAFEEPERIVRAILAGADGYLVKRSDAREVLEEIRAVVAGGSPMTPSVARSVLATVRSGAPLPPGSPDGLARYGLSEREADWKAFETLLTRVEKRAPRALSEAELLSLPLLYRSTLSSLSVARATSR